MTLENLKITGRTREICEQIARRRADKDYSVGIDTIFTDFLWHDFLLLEAENNRLQALLDTTHDQ